MKLFILLILLCSCKASSFDECRNKVTYQFEKNSDKAKSDHRIINKSYNSVTIYFMNTFNHTVNLSYGDKILFNEHVVTDDRTSTTGKYATMKIKNGEKNLFHLQIDQYCAKIPIREKYELIYVFLFKEEIVIRYSNTLYENI